MEVCIESHVWIFVQGIILGGAIGLLTVSILNRLGINQFGRSE